MNSNLKNNTFIFILFACIYLIATYAFLSYRQDDSIIETDKDQPHFKKAIMLPVNSGVDSDQDIFEGGVSIERFDSIAENNTMPDGGLSQDKADVVVGSDGAGFCLKTYNDTKECPVDQCYLECYDFDGAGACQKFECLPLPCYEIEATSCPLGRCQLLVGCAGAEVCYDMVDYVPEDCGGENYVGDNLPCCEGLTKRCGVQFFGGGCDMLGEYTIDSVPMCIPCGNGICNQFENSCNCPEDCQIDGEGEE